MIRVFVVTVLTFQLCGGCTRLSMLFDSDPSEDTMREPHPKFNADTVVFFELLEEGTNPTVSAAVRLNVNANSEHRTALAEAGAEVHTMVGEIVTFQAPALRLYNIADLDFVVSVEIATPMQLID